MSEAPLTVVIYAAKSTVDAKGSIPDQVEACREYAAAQDWTVDSVESDENASGFSGNRGDGLQNALDRAAEIAKEGTPAGMLVWNSNRIARGAGDETARHLVEYYFLAVRGHFELHSVTDDSQLQDPVYAAIAGKMAHEDSKLKSVNVRKGLERRRKLGLYGGGRVYGYDADKELGLVPNPDQAPVVRRIFTLVASGKSQAEAARTLNREGVKPLRGDKWSQPTVSKVIHNRTYLGEIRNDGAWTEAAHDAILTVELFDAAGSRSAAASKVKGRRGGPRPKADHLLPGKVIRHHKCGQAMVPRSNERQDGTVTGSYMCSGRKLGLCAGLTVRKEDVDEAIIAYVSEVGIDAEASLKLIREATDSTRETRAAALEQARTEATKVEAAHERMWRMFKDGDLEPEDWKRHKAEHETESAAAAEALERLEAQAASEAAPETLVPIAADALTIVRASVQAGDTDSVRVALESLFERFEIDRVENMPDQVLIGAQAELAAAHRKWSRKLSDLEAAAGKTVAQADAEYWAEQAALDNALEADEPEPAGTDPELDPVGLMILPVPREDVLKSITQDGQPVPLVDDAGRLVYRKVPLAAGADAPMTNNEALALASTGTRPPLSVLRFGAAV